MPRPPKSQNERDSLPTKNRVNAVIKGLRILEALNAHQGLNANNVAAIVGASRGATYRILQTLREAGYVQRDPTSGTYWLEPTVLGLSQGLSQETWVWKIAVPIMQKVGGKVVWPLSLVTPFGHQMIVRSSTDAQSPVTLHYMNVGATMPMVDTGGGLAYLAFCEKHQCELLIELAEKSTVGLQNSALVSKPVLMKQLDHIRDNGFCIHDGGNGVTVIAVPVFSRFRILAVLAIRYYSSAMRFKDGIRKYLAEIKQAAEEIGTGFDEYESWTTPES